MFRIRRINGIRMNRKPPQINKLRDGGRCKTISSIDSVERTGTSAQEGKSSVTHMSAFASAPPWMNRNRHAKSMTKSVNKAPMYDHHRVASEEASPTKTSSGCTVEKRRAAARRPTMETKYQTKTTWSIRFPCCASRIVGRPNTEPLA